MTTSTSNQMTVGQDPDGFGSMLRGNSGALAETSKSASVAEVIGMISVARRMPRDEVQAISTITRACQRRGLAEESQYHYARGGTPINGPSITLMRTIASAWGNMDWGWQWLERHEDQSVIRCWAWDMQQNVRAGRTFAIRHWRDTSDGGYPITDERDLYELISNAASRRVRACLEELVPADIVSKAMGTCDKTMESDSGEPLSDQIRASLAAFHQIGVTRAQIETKYQKKAEALTVYDVAALRKIYAAIRDGAAKPSDHFQENLEVAIEQAAKAPAAAVAELGRTLKAKQQETATQATPPTPKRGPGRPKKEEQDQEEEADEVPMEFPKQVVPPPEAPQARREPQSGAPAPSPNTQQGRLAKIITETYGATFDSFTTTIRRLGWHTVLLSVEKATSFDDLSNEDTRRLLNRIGSDLEKEIKEDIK